MPELRPGQIRHGSDNKVESERAEFALDLAKRGRKVAVVSGGDPGVFAMATAVLEVACEPAYADVPVRVLPGVTAANAAAAAAGAPLGHDYATISLSDRLKPWDVIEARLRAAMRRRPGHRPLQPGVEVPYAPGGRRPRPPARTPLARDPGGRRP